MGFVANAARGRGGAAHQRADGRLLPAAYLARLPPGLPAQGTEFPATIVLCGDPHMHVTNWLHV